MSSSRYVVVRCVPASRRSARRIPLRRARNRIPRRSRLAVVLDVVATSLLGDEAADLLLEVVTSFARSSRTSRTTRRRARAARRRPGRASSAAASTAVVHASRHARSGRGHRERRARPRRRGVAEGDDGAAGATGPRPASPRSTPLLRPPASRTTARTPETARQRGVGVRRLRIVECTPPRKPRRPAALGGGASANSPTCRGYAVDGRHRPRPRPPRPPGALVQVVRQARAAGPRPRRSVAGRASRGRRRRARVRTCGRPRSVTPTARAGRARARVAHASGRRRSNTSRSSSRLVRERSAPWPSLYSANEPCQSRWSSATLSSTATAGRNAAVVELRAGTTTPRRR